MRKRKKAGRPPGAEQKICDEAVQLAEELLCRREHKSKVKVVLWEKFRIQYRTAETVISRARARIMERSGKTIEEHRADAYAFYDSILRDPVADTRERIVAQARIDKLLGLQRPDRIEHTGANGEAIKVDASYDFSKLAPDELDALEEVLTKAAQG